MRALRSRIRPTATRTRRVLGIALVAAVSTVSAAAESAIRLSLANAVPEFRVGTLALKWLAEMDTDEIDRTQLTADYNV